MSFRIERKRAFTNAKVIAATIVSVGVLFTACGQSDPAKMILGEWKQGEFRLVFFTDGSAVEDLQRDPKARIDWRWTLGGHSLKMVTLNDSKECLTSVNVTRQQLTIGPCDFGQVVRPDGRGKITIQYISGTWTR